MSRRNNGTKMTSQFAGRNPMRYAMKTHCHRDTLNDYCREYHQSTAFLENVKTLAKVERIEAYLVRITNYDRSRHTVQRFTSELEFEMGKEYCAFFKVKRWIEQDADEYGPNWDCELGERVADHEGW